MVITPNTKLDAINEMLASIGIAPVNTIEDSEDIDVMNALKILESTDTTVQQKGWTFNLFENYLLIPDEFTLKIRWDTQWLAILDKNFTRRDDYLFNIAEQKSDFTDSVTVSLIYRTAFEDLPPVFRHYITIMACVAYSSRYLGDPQMIQQLQMELAQAYQAVMEYEMEIEGNSLQNNTAITQLMRR